MRVVVRGKGCRIKQSTQHRNPVRRDMQERRGVSQWVCRAAARQAEGGVQPELRGGRLSVAGGEGSGWGGEGSI